jgi:Activator of Hsp90 ATPase homolog 1-like protein
MTIITSEWSSFTLRVPVSSTVQKIYDCWATQQGLESWFLRKAEFTKPDGSKRIMNEHIQIGDVYEWLWFGYGDDVVERREVIEANGKDRFQFVFSGGCIVTVSIKQESSETICELEQTNIPLDQDPKMNLCLNCSSGWTFYLTNLKSVIEGGLDLRNKNDKLVSVITA